MQKYLLDQIWKVDVELKISNNQKIFLHKKMWKHHMTSPNFGEIFKCNNQMVAVQQRLQIHEKSFKKNKAQEKQLCN